MFVFLLPTKDLMIQRGKLHHRLGSCYLIHISLSSDKKKMQNKYFYTCKKPRKTFQSKSIVLKHAGTRSPLAALRTLLPIQSCIFLRISRSPQTIKLLFHIKRQTKITPTFVGFLKTFYFLCGTVNFFLLVS